MTITLDTTVRGSVDITAQQILRRLDSDPRPHIYSAADRREIAEKIIAWASVFGARASLNAAQIIHETGAFRYGGQVKPEQWNFAGIGATNDGAAGASFPNIDTGVLAYFCHWALYVYGHPDNWPEHLRKHRQWAIRLGPVQSAGYLGVITIMRDWTNGRWAWSPQYPRGSLLNGYAQAIVNGANRIREFPVDEEKPPVSDILGVPFRRSHIPTGNSNRPGGHHRKTHIINHETGNSSPGANAEMHRRFTHNGGGIHNVSFQYVVDDHEIIELLPPNEDANHGGDGRTGTCNRHGIGIEICINSDGNFNRALEHAAKLNVWLLGEHNLIPPDIVWQHWNCSRKNCPMRLRAGGWNAYVARIMALYDDKPKEKVIKLPKHPDLDAAFHPDHGFAGYMRWLIGKVGKQEALLLVGYPITDEFEEDGQVVQYTERMRFEWHPGKRPQRYDVLLGRTGAELIEAKARIKELEDELAKTRT